MCLTCQDVVETIEIGNNKMVGNKLISFLLGVVVSLSLLFLLGIALYFATGGLWPAVSDIKDYAEIAKNIAQITALLVAGLWTYRLFVKQRLEYPYVESECQFKHFLLTDGKLCLSVIMKLKNVGQVLLEIERGWICVEQVRPLSEELSDLVKEADQRDIKKRTVKGLFKGDTQHINWPEVGAVEFDESGKPDKPDAKNGPAMRIEPGETEVLAYEFVLESTVKTVKVTGYFENKYVENRWRSVVLTNWRRFVNFLLRRASPKPETRGWHIVEVHDIPEVDNDEPKHSVFRWFTWNNRKGTKHVRG